MNSASNWTSDRAAGECLTSRVVAPWTWAPTTDHDGTVVAARVDRPFVPRCWTWNDADRGATRKAPLSARSPCRRDSRGPCTSWWNSSSQAPGAGSRSHRCTGQSGWGRPAGNRTRTRVDTCSSNRAVWWSPSHRVKSADPGTSSLIKMRLGLGFNSLGVGY